MRGSNSRLPHTTETGCRWFYGNISHIVQPNLNANVNLPGISQEKKNRLSLCRDLPLGERTRKSEARVDNRLQQERELIAGARCRNGPLQPFGALITRGGGGGASASATSGNTEEPPQTGYDSITWR